MTTLPTYEEIYNGPGSRFENETAVEHYLGVSLEDAMRRIGDGTTQYIEDLLCMGPHAFRFYTAAMVEYLKSDSSTDDYQAWGWLQTLVHDRMKDLAVEPAKSMALEALRYILEHESKFTDGGDEYRHDPRDLIAQLEAG